MSNPPSSARSSGAARLSPLILPPLAIAGLLILQCVSGAGGFDREALGSGASILGLPGYLFGWGSLFLLLPLLVWTVLEWLGKNPTGLFLSILGAATLGIAVAGLSAVFDGASSGGQIGEALAPLLVDAISTVPAVLLLVIMAIPAAVLAYSPLLGRLFTHNQVLQSGESIHSGGALPGSPVRTATVSSGSLPSSSSLSSYTEKIRNKFSSFRSARSSTTHDESLRGDESLDSTIRYLDAETTSEVMEDGEDASYRHAAGRDVGAEYDDSSSPEAAVAEPEAEPAYVPRYDSDAPIEVDIDEDAFDEPAYVAPSEMGIQVVSRASTAQPTSLSGGDTRPEDLYDADDDENEPLHVSGSTHPGTPRKGVPRSIEEIEGQGPAALEHWARIDTSDDDSPIHMGADGKPVKVTVAELHPGTVFPATDTRSPIRKGERTIDANSLEHTTTQEDLSVAVRAHSESRPTGSRIDQSMRDRSTRPVPSSQSSTGKALSDTSPARAQLEAAAAGDDTNLRDVGSMAAKSATLPSRLGPSHLGGQRTSGGSKSTGERTSPPSRAMILNALRGLPTLRAAERQGADSPSENVRDSVRNSLGQVSGRSRYKEKLAASGIFDETAAVNAKPAKLVAEAPAQRDASKTASVKPKKLAKAKQAVSKKATKKKASRKKAAKKSAAQKKTTKKTTKKSTKKAAAKKTASRKASTKRATSRKAASNRSKKAAAKKKAPKRKTPKKPTPFGGLQDRLLDKGSRTLERAVEVAVDKGAATPILLTRRLQIPLDRAETLVTQLVALGVLGPASTRGSFPTLLSQKDWSKIRK